MRSNYSRDYIKVLTAISDVAIIAYTDPKGRITFANKNFCTISGYTPEELFNQDHRILNSNYHDKEFFQNIYKTINDGQIWRGEIRNRKKDGSHYWVDTQIIPIFNDNNEMENIVSVRFDITGKKLLEQSLIKMEKMASLGEMSAAIAHEINNPLCIVDLCAITLVKDMQKGNIDLATFEQKLEKIIVSTKRISKLVSGLKTISRSSETDSNAFVKTNLSQFVDELTSFCKQKCINSEIEFKMTNIPNIEFDCHPDQISQVLVNLLNNAHDAVAHLNEKWVEFSVVVDPASNYLIFNIRDSGKIISDTISDKIFDPFFTTKEVGMGTGLGLSISKAIAEGHSGELYLNKDDKHTLFSFVIPINQNKAQKKVA